MSELILFAAKGHTDSGGEAVLGFVFIVIVAVIAIVVSVQKGKYVVWKGGVPCCPNCGRQISLKLARPNCRACGYNLLSPPAQPARDIGEILMRQASLDQELRTRRHTRPDQTCEALKSLLIGPIQYRTSGVELQISRKNLYTVMVREIYDDHVVGWSVQNGPEFQRMVATLKPAGWPMCRPTPPYEELAQVVSRVDHTIIVGKKSRARPLELTCPATQGSYCMTTQEYEQLKRNHLAERERQNQLALRNARRGQEQQEREAAEQNRALLVLAKQEEQRALLEAQAKRQRRREWYKQHEAVLLGVGLPTAVVGVTAMLILVIHLLTH